MKPILLTDFGIENPAIAVSNSVFEVSKEIQTCLIDVPFVCPISKVEWKSREWHDAKCKYKYCKNGKWQFKNI